MEDSLTFSPKAISLAISFNCAVIDRKETALDLEAACQRIRGHLRR